MSHRKQVFQSKVLQKLYPAASTLIKEHSPSPSAEAQAKITTGKRKASEQDSVSDAGKTQITANPRHRIYTVLPPPPDYSLHSDKSVAVPQFENINGDENPAGGSAHNSSEEVDEQDEAEEQKRRRKRRKRKPIPLQDAEKDGAPVSESTSPSQEPVAEGGERISRNKKRKLKKKRHKEKLLSMGLMPRAAALEFTYQKYEDEEENTRRAAELSEFLRTTAGIYMSDSSLHAAKNPHLSAVVDDLLSSITSGSKPSSVLNLLCCLKTLAQNKETDRLEKALMELNNNQIVSAEETTAVVSLFKYWITEILPLQREEETRLSTA